MKTKDTIRLLAEILAGIQVAGSMGALGSALTPWLELRGHLRLSGWHTSDEAETALRATLHTEKPE